MLRTLLSPRLVGLHLVTIAVLISFAFLGRWQLGVFEDSAKPHAILDPAPVALTSLVRAGERVPVEAISRRVTARGIFDASRQLLVAERTPTVESGGGAVKDGGYWLLTPLLLADGTRMPVVRGWVPSATDPATAVPAGTVTVAGRVQPSEPTDFAKRRTSPLPAGQVATVSTAELVNVWRDVRLRDGFVVATGPVAAERPASATPDARPVDVPPPSEGGGFSWRNLAYAAQWWIFAGFAVFMWFHFVRDALRTARAGETPQDDSDGFTGKDPREGPDGGATGEAPDEAPGEAAEVSANALGGGPRPGGASPQE
ncbi:SURF1 family protein [Sphaerisporangium perillae]|uniref:SURF1 family protein n=1 Tax=Sphaerisporangium perillae TaxID=2935860 RepID=UPI00200CFAB2|nr:SURF1 family protein [Sphaerisporangium perillae]